MKFLFVLGLDIHKHGEPAYPLASYGDGWGSAASPAAETNSLPFTIQLKFAPPHKGRSPTPVQNGQSNTPSSRDNVIANPGAVNENPKAGTNTAL